MGAESSLTRSPAFVVRCIMTSCYEGHPACGGKGTRLRPLTVHTPKPIVPIFNRPFLYYQIDLLRQVPEIDEAILSLNYQPRRIEEIFGEGEGLGIRLRYVVEPIPLGTGGAIRYAGDQLTESVVVFNGDVLTEVDLGAVLRLHRERQCQSDDRPDAGRESARLRPGRDGSAGQHPPIPGEAGRGRDHLQHDQRGHLRARAGDVRAHSEGHRVVDRAQLLPVADRARRNVRGLCLRRLLDRHRHAGQVSAGPSRHHGRPLLGAAVRGQRRRAQRVERASRWAFVADARASRTASSCTAPASSMTAAVIKAGAKSCPMRSSAGTPTSRKRRSSRTRSSGRTAGSAARRTSRGSILGRNCHIGRNAALVHGAVLGDKTVITDYSKL